MMAGEMVFTIDRATGTQQISVHAPYVLCCGWSGRNQHDVKAHIDELVKLGVPAPSETPILFSITQDMLTTECHIDVQGMETNGEIEYVLLNVAGEWLVTVGSDQTDRDAERFGIEKSKQMCPKIMGTVLWPLCEVAGHWDSLRLTAWVTLDGQRQVYQDESLSSLIRYETLLDLVRRKVPGIAEQVPVYSGTIPTRTGLVFADLFEMQLHDPVLNRSIYHRYRVRSLVRVLGL